MVLVRGEGKIFHTRFRDFPDFLNRGDVLVVNDTKVIPAKVWGKKGEATIEFLFLKELATGRWEVLSKPARRVRPGEKIAFPDGLEAEVIGTGKEGRRILGFGTRDVLGHLKKIGYAPLPPYIKRKKEDAGQRPKDLSRYQTIFAAKGSAIAAPTAGLHFTSRVLQHIRERGVRIARVTLDVGLATFQPVRVNRVEDHVMLEEAYSIAKRAAAEISRAKEESRPVVAVGTTVVRALESAARNFSAPGISGNVPHPPEISAEGISPANKKERNLRPESIIQQALEPKSKDIGHQWIRPGFATTSVFIRPGFEFKIVDRLLTNFHLPKSTLLMLVSAFAGREFILHAYHEAVRQRYRFFSYGDCMLII
jgi:S-adenosylmethionine:tRNA ribosyltransferase-isomerase